MFSPLSVQSQPINKCGISFTAATRRLIFMKKRRNGHLLAPADTWLRVDSDHKRTWQLNYTPSARFLFYLGDRNPCCLADPHALKHGRLRSWLLLWIYTETFNKEKAICKSYYDTDRNVDFFMRCRPWNPIRNV